MEGSYPVMIGDKAVGKVQVLREGLYYRFICRCQLTGDVIYKLVASCGGNQISLGVLVPTGSGFGLETRIAMKRLGRGELKFRASPRHAELRGKFVPVYPDEPFSYIAKLKHAHMERRNGQVGIVIPD